MARQREAVLVDYEALFRSAPAGCALTLGDGTVVEANDTLLRWTGLTRARLLETDLLELFAAGDRERFAFEVLPQLAAGTAGELEVVLKGAHGPVPAVLSATRHTTAGSVPPLDMFVLSRSPHPPPRDHGMEVPPRTFRDSDSAAVRAETRTTRHGGDLREKERELRQHLLESRKNEALLRTVLDTVDVGVAVLDADGGTVLENARHQSHLRRATPEGIDSPRSADLLVYRPDRTTPVPAVDRVVPRLVKGESFADELIWIGPRHDQRALSV